MKPRTKHILYFVIAVVALLAFFALGASTFTDIEASGNVNISGDLNMSAAAGGEIQNVGNMTGVNGAVIRFID